MKKLFFNVILRLQPKDLLRFFTSFRMTGNGGFTLIELLIVISVIGILSSFLLVNFVGVRQRARDGTRKFDLRQIQSALELYRSDQGKYRSSLPVCTTAAPAFTDGGIPAVVYMTKIPCDPSTGVSYYYSSPGINNTYCVRTCLENSNDAERDELPAKYNANNPAIGACSLASCSGGTKSYSLQNP